jgi:hypothetical protein
LVPDGWKGPPPSRKPASDTLTCGEWARIGCGGGAFAVRALVWLPAAGAILAPEDEKASAVLFIYQSHSFVLADVDVQANAL